MTPSGFPVIALVGSAGGLGSLILSGAFPPGRPSADLLLATHATDETSSNHYSMPLAAIERDEAVDRVLPLDDIAVALRELVAGCDAAVP